MLFRMFGVAPFTFGFMFLLLTGTIWYGSATIMTHSSFLTHKSDKARFLLIGVLSLLLALVIEFLFGGFFALLMYLDYVVTR